MMAVAAWLVWQRGGIAAQRRALMWFILQLGLNAAWTPLFFGLHILAIAFVEMLLLWAAIAVTVRAFFRVDRLAGWLLVPYLAFAAVLNFTLWGMNP
jgi:tryptophan-rich sensory protein